jgi:5-methylcytosine-specific restriction endonuclease McrA
LLKELAVRALPDSVREDQQPADMVEQAEKEALPGKTAGNGASENGVAEAVDVDVLIRAPVLVLNLNYVPVNVCTVRRAIVLVTKGKAEQLESHLGQLHTVSRDIDAPSVIRLAYMVKRPFLPRKLSKKEVFMRDKFTCQYCGKKVHDLTLDHVIPRRQHGAHTWENVVAACSRCNLHKAGRTPAEAKMRLGTVPRAPDPNPYLILQNRVILDEWEIYIPWSIRDEPSRIS